MKTTACLFLLLFPFITNAQQPGTLDKSFGEGGKVRSTTYQGLPYASLLQPDGKIIVGGDGGYQKGDVVIGSSLLARYNTDGTLDLSFGDSGRIAYSLRDPFYAKPIYAMALQKDGKIVAAVSNYDNGSIAVMRVNADGTLDKSFGEGGLASKTVANTICYGTDMALLPDGRIAVTGDLTSDINDDNRSFLACFTPDGKIDNSFGDNGSGLTIIELSEAMDMNAIAVTGEGKIVIGGTDRIEFKNLLLRYSKDGKRDQSFGVNGIAEMVFSKDIADGTLKDILLTADNKIITGGVIYPNTGRAAIAAGRFTSEGMVDSSFGTNGYSLAKYDNEDAYANSIALQPNGRIVAGGYSVNKGTGGVTTVRYNGDGTIDSTYGTDGITETTFTGDDIGSSLLIQPDGRIVLVGYSQTRNADGVFTTLVRYNGDDGNKQPLAIRIRRWLQHHGISWQYNNNVRYYSVQRSVDGGITYKEVASVSSKTNSYEDNTAINSNSTALYRLAAVAKDGSRTYSNTVLIDDAQSARIFPNPVKDNLQLQGLPATGKTSLSVMDLNGNVRSSATATGTSYSVSTANLSSGSYLLKIQHNGTTVTLPFVKE